MYRKSKKKKTQKKAVVSNKREGGKNNSFSRLEFDGCMYMYQYIF